SGDYEIYTMRADGTHVRRLTHDPSADREPSWSPVRSAGGRFARDRVTVWTTSCAADRGRNSSAPSAETTPSSPPPGDTIASSAALEATASRRATAASTSSAAAPEKTPSSPTASTSWVSTASASSDEAPVAGIGVTPAPRQPGDRRTPTRERPNRVRA